MRGTAVVAIAAAIATPARAVLWNATDTSYSAINTTGGLTDNYGQLVNESIITNTGGGFFGTCTYLQNGWFLTARHVVQNGSDYNTLAPPAVMQINVYGQNYSGDQIVAFGSADVALIHVGGATSGQITTLPGVEKRQVAGPGNGLAQLAGFGLNGTFGSVPVNNATFHRAFNTPYVNGAFLEVNANQNSRLLTDGYVLGMLQGGDSGSGMWEDNGPSDQDLDTYDWSLTGVAQTAGGTALGNASGGYGFLQAYASTIWSTVYPHAVLTYNANAGSTTTATDGSGTWNKTTANWTDGTNFAFNGPERTEQAIFGAGNGAAGTVTLGSTVAVSDLVFNAAGSGNYTIAGAAGTSLSMRASSRITTNADATISANITGGGANGLHGFGSFPTFARLAKFGGATLTLTGNTTLDIGTAFYARAGTTVLASSGTFAPGFYTSIAEYTGDTATLTLKDDAVYNSANQDFNLGDLGGTGTLNVQGNASLTIGAMYVGKGYTQPTNPNGSQQSSGAGVGVVNQTGGMVTATSISLGSSNVASSGTYNLGGGTLRTGGITRGSGVGNINFNGGTLLATGSNTAFLSAVSAATINTGGATINTNGNNITIAQPLAHAGSGTDGGLTKTGSGTLTVTGGSTYTGNTTINAGTLKLGSNAPVATYSFDNVSGGTVVNDGTGGATMNGTLSGGATIVAAGGGRAGNALSVSGGASVNINTAITDLGNAGSWTVSAYVKTTTPGSSILTKGDGSTWNYGYTVFYLGDGTDGGSGAVPSSVRYAGGWFQGSTAARPVADGVWHQVIYVNSGGLYAIYVDGVAQPLSAGNASFGVPDTGTVVRLGASTDPGTYDGTKNFNGLLDDVRFYNSGLTAAQVAAMFNNAALPVGPLPTSTNISIAGAATLDVNGVMQQVGSLTGAAGSSILLGNGQLIVGGPSTTTFAGAMSGAGSFVKTGSGSLTLSGTNTHTGTTSVMGGKLVLAETQALELSPVSVTSGTLQLATGSTSFVQVSSLSVVLPGTVEIGSTGLVISTTGGGTTTLATLDDAILSGRIISTATAGVAGDAIGFASGAELNGTFQSASVDPSAVAVLATLTGDANLDRSVNFADLLALARNYGATTNADWAQGDANHDGAVNFSDLLALARNYGATFSGVPSNADPVTFAADWALAQSLVPEPATFVAALGLCVLMPGRRHRRPSDHESFSRR